MVKFKLQKRLMYTLLAVLTVIVIAIGINAYGGSSPSIVGHTFGELTPPTGCSSNQVIKWTGSGWTCTTPAASITLNPAIYYTNDQSINMGSHRFCFLTNVTEMGSGPVGCGVTESTGAWTLGASPSGKCIARCVD